MSLRHALLGLLAQDPHTGYGLVKHFQGSLNYAWAAQHSQIYPELARLLDAGLIRRRGEEGPRGAKTYETTEAGLVELRRWLRETAPDRRVRSDPALRLFFLWLLEREEAIAYLERERDFYRALLAEYEQIAAEGEPRTPKEWSYRIALEGGIRGARARVEWAEWAAERVRSLPW